MREDQRLRDEGATALERALLDAGSAYRGSRSARAKTLGALGLAGSASAMAAAGGTAKASLAGAAKLSLSKLLAGAAICGAVAAVPVGYSVWHHQRSVPHRARAIAAAEPIAEPAPAVTGGPAATPGDSTAAPEIAAPAVTHHRRAAEDEAPVPLSRELASLDAARASLARGDAAGAIVRLDRYARAYPRGRLDLEAEVLRIDALAESGRTEASRARARDFLRHHPNSVLAAHVRSRLAD